MKLAMGITEPNPNFVWPPAAKEVPPAFDRWRRVLDAARPAIYRLVVEWNRVQPDPARPPDWDVPQTGCLRDRKPCSEWGGVREQLAAVRAQQQAVPDGRWRILVVLAGTPDWAAERPRGCEREGTTARSRAVRADAVPAYRSFIGSLQELGRQSGIALPYWTPWNEPNHPYALSPQRVACDGAARSAATAPYTRLAEALRDALEDDQTLVLGEAAGLTRRTAQATTLGELVRALPKDVVCAAPIWSQHAYVGGTDPVEQVQRALDARGCERRHEIWVTETGSGGPRRGDGQLRPRGAVERGCRLLAARLRRWHADPRVTTAVQYTLREDDVFPTGLVSVDLERAYPMLGLFGAWARRDPADPPPSGTFC